MKNILTKVSEMNYKTADTIIIVCFVFLQCKLLCYLYLYLITSLPFPMPYTPLLFCVRSVQLLPPLHSPGPLPASFQLTWMMVLGHLW